MINNLSYCNNLRLFQEAENNYLSILKEIKNIKELIDDFPDNISIKYVLFSGIGLLNKKIINIKKLIMKVMNHISSENINLIFKIFVNDLWIANFDKDDLDKIIFISKFIRPISIWDSNEHLQQMELNNPEPNKKNTIISKDLLKSLITMKSQPEENNTLIIASDSSLPNFLRSISDFVEITTPKKNSNIKNNHFNKQDCKNILDNENIIITRNSRSNTLVEDKYGCLITININNKFIVIQGIFKDDLLNFSSSIKFVRDKLIQHKNSFSEEILFIPQSFKDSYFKIISLRDLIVCSSTELISDLRRKYNDFKIIQSKTLVVLINEFLLASKYRNNTVIDIDKIGEFFFKSAGANSPSKSA
jgi:hypothetical protein